ncbi:bifunctional 5,10-methylenetetrahydrofolate dehydrogenase/5,10-methenyltetrahydrofolate cyclohydrolase [Spiroplasma chrysopicola]|uniref:Bifunctional protein FolD n=1 Tax=Spiroplasma chrysopicola DF-1 TaxID=1276227 RepID=R4UBB7_9MOLU|nr:bifunctional 5,10-methylenetetrahydrofolate dehydrogenase/5,10-methenyltetrahydrofolate cyclohydrolase [Spiroplasma chrysopicola]AGM25174.1 methylenetetrahydrofolate dehydrogenase/methylenetetrahydrofolate cyclohydrolase [Spiroplasma chrysopicola DF-1]
MVNKIIDGKQISAQIKEEIKGEINARKNKGYREPKLVIIQVGDLAASTTYIKNKKIACEKVGIICEIIKQPSDISEEILVNQIKQLNNDNSVDGILVQLPLPPQINSLLITETIAIEKDVDGFSPTILGKMLLSNASPNEIVLPATPKGIMNLLEYNKIDLTGKHVVIVGRSNIVGKPIANLVLNANGTITVCHSKTKNLATLTKQADILIVAIGKANFITKEMLKKDVIIIDVGTNYDQNNKLCGDVDFANVIDYVKQITPVPGGVGPMTIAALLQNLILLYQSHL